MKRQILAVALCATLSPTLARATDQKHLDWSVDLGKYGYSTGRSGAANVLPFGTVVAATDKYVAVGLDVREPATGSSRVPPGSPSKLSLLVFDVDSGKLSRECGPWSVIAGFDLWATASGNFLLHLTPLSDASLQASEMLLLLSPTCGQLKQMHLPSQDGPEHLSWQILESPSRQTLLLTRAQKVGNNYQLLGTDNLDFKSQWFETDSKAPVTIGVSDKGLLGVIRRPASAISEDIHDEHYYRTFDGPWRRLLFSGDYSFLSDDVLVGTLGSTQQPWKVSKTKVTTIRLDGTSMFSATVSGAGYHVERTSDIWASSDGSYFAFALDFAGAGWLWGNLDMGPEHRSVYVWSLSRATPCAKIKLRSWWLGQPPLAFAPDGSWFALLVDSSTLRVRALP